MGLLEVIFKNTAEFLWGNWLLYVLLGLGILYTVMSGGIQLRALPFLWREFFHLQDKNQGKKTVEKGSLTSLQALYTAIASCVGSGNIVGVGTALIAGGPGALLWMWIAAFFGMATKYGEIVLGIFYREKDGDGGFLGGPMYYIAKGLHAPWLGILAAFLLFFQNAGGTLIQSNTISMAAREAFQIPRPVTGIVLAALMSFIIRGGLKRLAQVAQRIVPVMAGLYVAGGLIVILVHSDMLLPMFYSILSGAFSLEAGMGAVAGITIKEAMRFGVARGLYSNEAGEGSAAVLHASAQVDHPSRQGMFGVAEVFVDTMVICSTTGFAILASGIDLTGANAATLAASAFATVFPSFGNVVSLSLILFAATSLMSQWYFGHVSLLYIKSRRGDTVYKFLFPLLIIYGSLSTVDLVWAIQDCMLGLLIIPNAVALVVLSPMVRRMTKEFFDLNKKQTQ